MSLKPRRCLLYRSTRLLLLGVLAFLPACAKRPYSDVDWSRPERSFPFESDGSASGDTERGVSWRIDSIDTNGEDWWLVVTRTRHFNRSSLSLTFVMDGMNLHLYSDEFAGSAIESDDGELRVQLVVDTSVIAGPNIMPWPSYERDGTTHFCAPLRDPARVSEAFEYAERLRSPLFIRLNEEAARGLGDSYRYRPEME